MSQNSLRVEISTPEKEFYQGEVDMIITKTINGNIGIKAKHAPLVTVLDIGKTVIKEKGKDKVATINGGFLEVKDNVVSIFTDSAEWPNEIDKNRAKEALKRAEMRLRDKKSKDIDFERAELALKRAINRINIIG